MDLAARFALHRQSRSVVPARGEFGGSRHLHVVARLPLGIQHHLVPAQQIQLRGRGSAGRETFRRRRHHQVEADAQRVRARGNVQVKSKHIVEITMPPQPPFACIELKPGEIGDRSGGTVLSGNPLGIDQRQVSRRDRNPQFGAQNLLRRPRGVDHQLDRPGGHGRRRRFRRRRVLAFLCHRRRGDQQNGSKNGG